MALSNGVGLGPALASGGGGSSSASSIGSGGSAGVGGPGSGVQGLGGLGHEGSRDKRRRGCAGEGFGQRERELATIGETLGWCFGKGFRHNGVHSPGKGGISRARRRRSLVDDLVGQGGNGMGTK